MACLDTTVLLDLQGRSGRGKKRRAAELVRRLVAAGEDLVTTRFNVAELWVGVERSSDPKREESRVEKLLAGLGILEFDAAAARVFGAVTAHLQKLGRPAGDMDVLIASVAIANDHILVTRNAKHFADIPGLGVECYN